MVHSTVLCERPLLETWVLGVWTMERTVHDGEPHSLPVIDDHRPPTGRERIIVLVETPIKK